nr:cytochrome c oxidase subunit 3 [Megaginus tataupensis]
MKKIYGSGFHPFHIVSFSPWPILGSLATLSVALNFLNFVYLTGKFSMVLLSVLSLIFVLFQWWRDVVRESTYQGWHTEKVCRGLYLGMIMFISSEVMFFFSFFFGYFFTSLNPDIQIGMMWPPKGVQPLDYMGVPFLNTILLLSSGVSITWAHHCINESLKSSSVKSLIITIILGILFTFFQYLEYFDCSFTIADSCYGSFFFIMTGFHGIHVIVGAIFIMVSTTRLWFNHFSSKHMIGFEMAAWYWHFVDVVWLMLFITVYWWGS